MMLDFADYLGKVREGTLPIIEDIWQHKVQLLEELNLGSSRLTDLWDFVFYNLDAHHQDHEWLASRAIITPLVGVMMGMVNGE